MQQIVSRKVADLVPYARNARTHNEAQVAQIVASIEEFGWTNPVLIDEASGIIAGHGRVLAARRMGRDEVGCIVLAGLTEGQKRAYVIADNKLALNAGWDAELLALEFDEIAALGFDLELTGFTFDEINGMRPGAAGGGSGSSPSLADRFMIPPFSVLNAREGWWQDRKRAWLALGIKSELGRGDAHQLTNGSMQSMEYAGGFKPRHGAQRQAAAPGGSARPAADYSKRQRGNGAGRAMNG